VKGAPARSSSTCRRRVDLRTARPRSATWVRRSGATCRCSARPPQRAVPEVDRTRTRSQRWPTSTPSTSDPTPRWGPRRAVHDRVIDIDLDELEPHVVGPHTPDPTAPCRSWPLRRGGGYPLTVSTALVARAPTRRTRHSVGPRTWPVRPGRRPEGQVAAAHHGPVRAGAGHHRRDGIPRGPRGDRATCWPTPAVRASAVASATTSSGRGQLDRCRRSPELPGRNDGNASTLSSSRPGVGGGLRAHRPARHRLTPIDPDRQRLGAPRPAPRHELRRRASTRASRLRGPRGRRHRGRSRRGARLRPDSSSSSRSRPRSARIWG